MTIRPLPVALDPRPGQDIDSYLVTLAAVNGIASRDMTHLVSDAASVTLRNTRSSPTRHAPDPAIMSAINLLTGQPEPRLRAMSLLRYAPSSQVGPGTLLPWKPRVGCHICPRCIAEQPTVRPLWWHVPHATICPWYHCLLHQTCPHCHQRFRINTTPALPDDLQRCDNRYSGSGTTVVTCDQPLADLTVMSVSDDEIRAAATLFDATHAEKIIMWGQPTRPHDYLLNVYSLTVLLTHLAAAGAAEDRPWTPAVHQQQNGRGTARQRLSQSPLHDVAARSRVLTESVGILDHAEPDSAADYLAAHLHRIPSDKAGPLAWIAGHTHLTKTTSRLTIKAIAPKRTVSFQLATLLPPISVPAHAVPQCIPQHLYEQYFADTLGVLDTTGRVFVALCCARRLPGVRSWEDAGLILGIDAASAVRIPMNVSPRMHISTTELVNRVAAVGNHLDATTNYRRREAHVTTLHETPELWYPRWQKRFARHGTPRTGIANACEWHWQYYACGKPYAQPWTHSWDSQRCYRFHLWCRTLGKQVRPVIKLPPQRTDSTTTT